MVVNIGIDSLAGGSAYKLTCLLRIKLFAVISNLAGGDAGELVLGMAVIPVSCRWITEGSTVGL